jgi:hypothetical protein
VKVIFCGIRDLSFIAADSIFFGRVQFQLSDDALPEHQMAIGHDVDLNIRLKGDASWPFERVEQEFLAKAIDALGLVSKHLDGATVQSIEQHNRAMEAEAQ